METHIANKSEIDLKKFIKIGNIDNGGYGFVYKIKEIKTGIIYAAKTLNSTTDPEKSIDREVDIMLFTNHPAIIKFIGYSRKDFINTDNVTIIMEYAQNGSLSKILEQFQRGKTPKKITNTTRQIIMAGIARGMQYLHNHNIIHRDLKPQNILLDSNYYPYISDFGLSKYFLDGHSGNQSIFLGTVIYEAPEINTDEPCDRKIDVYAFGIILYQIVTNSFFPYPELEHKKITQIALLNKIINEDYRPAFKSHVKEDLKILIQNCWAKSPEDRPSFNEIFEKLSNMNGDNKYLLDDVDLDKFNSYIEYVSKVDERLDIQLDRIIEIKSENQQLKEENKKLIRNNSKLENDYDELIDEKEILEKINVDQRKKIKLLSKKVESTKKDTEKNDDYEQLFNENENLRNENEKNINVIENLKSSNQDLKDSNKKIENDLKKIYQRK